MITRIKYTKEGKLYVSFAIQINYKLRVRIEIDERFVMKIVEHPNYKTRVALPCTSLQSAKRKGRKELEKLGLNFNNEIRRKNERRQKKTKESNND